MVLISISQYPKSDVLVFFKTIHLHPFSSFHTETFLIYSQRFGKWIWNRHFLQIVILKIVWPILGFIRHSLQANWYLLQNDHHFVMLHASWIFFWPYWPLTCQHFLHLHIGLLGGGALVVVGAGELLKCFYNPSATNVNSITTFPFFIHGCSYEYKLTLPLIWQLLSNEVSITYSCVFTLLL